MKTFVSRGFSAYVPSEFFKTILSKSFHLISSHELAELEIALVYGIDDQLIDVNVPVYEIHDVSFEGTVYIAWVYQEGRDGGGGNMREHLIGTLQLPIELKSRLVEKLLANERERRIQEQIQLALVEAHLDDTSVRQRRRDALVEVGLDEATIATRREQRLREIGLDNTTIAVQANTIETRIRTQSAPPQ